MDSRLPPKPDFETIDTAAYASADRRTALLALIGNLAFSWSNNESMFIYVLMLLLDTDEVSASIVFSTLNTTRARLDLIQRLSRTRIADKAIRKELDKLIERFNAATKLRNEFNHAMFQVDERGNITHTHSLRIVERRGQFKFGETRKIDQARFDELSKAIRDLRGLNRDIWNFLPRLQAHVPTRNG